jgi:hypothetical protein
VVREVVIADHVEFGGDVGVELLGLLGEFVGLGPGDLDGEVGLSVAVAGRGRDHALDGHLRDDDKSDRKALPGAHHDGGIHELVDALDVCEAVLALLDVDGAR